MASDMIRTLFMPGCGALTDESMFSTDGTPEADRKWNRLRLDST